MIYPMSVCRFTMIALAVFVIPPSTFAHGDLHDRILQVTGELNKSSSAELFFKRGCLHLEHCAGEAALADFSEAELLGHSGLEIDALKAEGLMLLGKDRPALEALNRCLNRDPSSSHCLVLRARVFGRLGESIAAIHDYRKALSLVSKPEPDLILEISTALAKNKQAIDALEVLDQGMVRLGPLASLMTAAIEIDLGIRNIEGALRRIDVARNAAPRPEPWMARKASILARAGSTAESQAEWQLLLDHIASLSPGERNSHAMHCCVQEAQAALATLKSKPP
jgi:tetratricopeptide (TPR) repeat protein